MSAQAEAWRTKRWSALDDAEKTEWVETARAGSLGRFTPAELCKHRDLAEEAGQAAGELEEAKAELEGATEASDEAHAALKDHQAEIETAADERARASA